MTLSGVGPEAMCHKVCHGRDKLCGAFAVCWDGDLRFVGMEIWGLLGWNICGLLGWYLGWRRFGVRQNMCICVNKNSRTKAKQTKSTEIKIDKIKMNQKKMARKISSISTEKSVDIEYYLVINR